MLYYYKGLLDLGAMCAAPMIKVCNKSIKYAIKVKVLTMHHIVCIDIQIEGGCFKTPVLIIAKFISSPFYLWNPMKTKCILHTIQTIWCIVRTFTSITYFILLLHTLYFYCILYSFIAYFNQSSDYLMIKSKIKAEGYYILFS
jgi:hypothetical protein